ncbi:MAG: PepSY domain-containing protein [Clostridiales bacterium]|nr:PepSY domain-containing protein [Clostridiales bacterium]
MKKIKEYFATPKKAILSSACAVAVLAVLGAGGAYAASAVAESTSIGSAAAQNFAFADAGVDPASARIERTKFGFKQGQFVYQVEFDADGTEYEYWIKASDGAVVKKETEQETPSNFHAALSLEDAKNKALTDAGVSAANAVFTKTKLEHDDGAVVYEIEFRTADMKYEYEIDAQSGAICKAKQEAIQLQTVAPGTQKLIDLDEAKNRALENAGVSASEVLFAETELHYDRGTAVYKVEFRTVNVKYDYEIDAQTGAIRKKKQEAAEQLPGVSDAGQLIGLETAKSKALSDAGVSASDVVFDEAKLDEDDGAAVYEIEFRTADTEYDYEIDALTGEIRKRKQEAIEQKSDIPEDQQLIGLEAAKNKALADAGVSAANATFIKAKLDYDDGAPVYELEFLTVNAEYEYKIHAATGAVLEKESEAIKNADPSKSYIGIEKAKKAALSHAGLSVSDVRFSKAKLDKDDGMMVYEVEFLANGMEYEYTVDAYTGEILEYEAEWDD